MSEELKPCPFCGRRVKWREGAIECSWCGLRFRPSPIYSLEKCVQMWNRRADRE